MERFVLTRDPGSRTWERHAVMPGDRPDLLPAGSAMILVRAEYAVLFDGERWHVIKDRTGALTR